MSGNIDATKKFCSPECIDGVKHCVFGALMCRKTASCSTFPAHQCAVESTYRTCSQEGIHARTETNRIVFLFKRSGARVSKYFTILAHFEWEARGLSHRRWPELHAASTGGIICLHASGRLAPLAPMPSFHSSGGVWNSAVQTIRLSLHCHKCLNTEK